MGPLFGEKGFKMGPIFGEKGFKMGPIFGEKGFKTGPIFGEKGFKMGPLFAYFRSNSPESSSSTPNQRQCSSIMVCVMLL